MLLNSTHVVTGVVTSPFLHINIIKKPQKIRKVFLSFLPPLSTCIFITDMGNVKKGLSADCKLSVQEKNSSHNDMYALNLLHRTLCKAQLSLDMLFFLKKCVKPFQEKNIGSFSKIHWQQAITCMSGYYPPNFQQRAEHLLPLLKLLHIISNFQILGLYVKVAFPVNQLCFWWPFKSTSKSPNFQEQVFIAL